jgi:hypothetical protein
LIWVKRKERVPYMRWFGEVVDKPSCCVAHLMTCSVEAKFIKETVREVSPERHPIELHVLASCHSNMCDPPARPPPPPPQNRIH